LGEEGEMTDKLCECVPHAEKWRTFPCKLTVCDACGNVIGWDESAHPPDKPPFDAVGWLRWRASQAMSDNAKAALMFSADALEAAMKERR
jgi:hypothetical protein